MPNDERNPKSEIRRGLRTAVRFFRYSSLDILSSFGIRHSSFSWPPPDFVVVFSSCFVHSYIAAHAFEVKVHNYGPCSGGNLLPRLTPASSCCGRCLLCDDDQWLQLRGQSIERDRCARRDQ